MITPVELLDSLCLWNLPVSGIFWWSAGSILQCERRREPEMDWLGRDRCVESAGRYS